MQTSDWLMFFLLNLTALIAIWFQNETVVQNSLICAHYVYF